MDPPQKWQKTCGEELLDELLDELRSSPFGRRRHGLMAASAEAQLPFGFPFLLNFQSWPLRCNVLLYFCVLCCTVTLNA